MLLFETGWSHPLQRFAPLFNIVYNNILSFRVIDVGCVYNSGSLDSYMHQIAANLWPTKVAVETKRPTETAKFGA
jgi:hypothetical protein